MKDEAESPVAKVTATASWVSPLPPPSVIAAYQEHIPNAGERILALAEFEIKTRNENTRLVLESSQEASRSYFRSVSKGQNCAVFLLLAIVLCATVCSIMGDWKSACGIAGIGFANVAAVFIGREYKARTRKE